MERNGSGGENIPVNGLSVLLRKTMKQEKHICPWCRKKVSSEKGDKCILAMRWWHREHYLLYLAERMPALDHLGFVDEKIVEKYATFRIPPLVQRVCANCGNTRPDTPCGYNRKRMCGVIDLIYWQPRPVTGILEMA